MSKAPSALPPLVFAGESPINAKFYNQYIEQAPFVEATGAHYIAAHSVPRMMDYVREAFHIAKYERQPVVLGITSANEQEITGGLHAGDRVVVGGSGNLQPGEKVQPQQAARDLVMYQPNSGKGGK